MPGIHYRLGRLLLSQPNPPPTVKDDARREFEEELKVDPSNAGANFVLGELARQAENWQRAVEYFSKATKLDASFADAYLGLGRSLLGANQAAEAVAPLETAAKLRPDNPVVHFNLATAYRCAGRKADADGENSLHIDKLRRRRTRRATRLRNRSRVQTCKGLLQPRNRRSRSMRDICAGAWGGILLLTISAALFSNAPEGIQFTDIAKTAGIRFTHYKGSHGVSTILEEAGPGVCVADFDGDGYQDIYFVNGRVLYGNGIEVRNALYRNNGDGAFSDVTERAGVPGNAYGLGCVWGDYNNGHQYLRHAIR